MRHSRIDDTWCYNGRRPMQCLCTYRCMTHAWRPDGHLCVGACRYFKSREVKGRAIDMFPPGRVIFVRPIKQVDEHGRKKGRRQWDTVWVQPTELIAEGILVSPRVRSYTYPLSMLQHCASVLHAHAVYLCHVAAAAVCT